jgi:iron complex outermembrane receptor protein
MTQDRSVVSVTSYWDSDATSVGDVDGGFGNFLPPNLYGGRNPFTAETRDSVPSSVSSRRNCASSNGDGALSDGFSF